MAKTLRPHRPSELQTAILRRAAAGFVLCTMVEGKRHFTYEDGSSVSCSAVDVERCIRSGWLKGDNDAPDDPETHSQVYRVIRENLST